MFGFLSNIRLLYVLIPVGVLAAAVSIPNFDVLSSNKGCPSTEIRPCYDQGTQKSVKIAKGKSGEQGFLACTQNATPNTVGSLSVETKMCKEESVSYCVLGNSGNFVREFTGACQDETPIPEPKPEPEPALNLDEVSISGKFINAITKEPLSGVRIWNPEIGMNTTITESSGTGEFTFVNDTTNITQSNTLYTSYTTGCYFQNWGFTSIDRNPDDSLRLKAVLFDFVPGDFIINPLMKADVDLGNVPLWPATTLLLRSDVPVKVSISYKEEGKILGNNILQTEHKLWNAIPLEHPTSVRLTDQNGTMYNSPEIKLPVSNNCTAAVLSFTGGEFTWQ